ncbi:hypothetical protein FACS1894181_17890 [Bacteroidia bacterium]|nr:hypothetical protein FACS1894181_17890 [Bacteroidia bacterium]
MSGGGTFDENTSQTVTATANPGYRFVNWAEGETPVSTSESYTFTLGGNRTLVANFELIPPAQYTLVVNDGTGGGSYTAGTVVNISANTAPSGRTFDQWRGDVSGVTNVNNASTAYTMGSANATVTATYKALPPTAYTLTVNNGTGGGSYTAGTVVNISANTAPAGQTFDKWTGDISGIANVNNASTTCTMGSANATVTTIYKALPPTLSSDATLSGLSLDIPSLNPAFSPSVTAYTATVASSVASVTISATANHASTTVSGTGTKSLNAGSNLFHVVVTAQDGTQKTYTITVTRDTDTAIESVALQTYKHTSAAIHYIYVARLRKW